MAYPNDPNDPNDLRRNTDLRRDTSSPSSARYIVPLALVAAFLVALAMSGMFSHTNTASDQTTAPTTSVSENAKPADSTPAPAPSSNTGASSGETGADTSASSPPAAQPAAPSPGPAPAPEKQPEQAPTPPAAQQ